MTFRRETICPGCVARRDSAQTMRRDDVVLRLQKAARMPAGGTARYSMRRIRGRTATESLSVRKPVLTTSHFRRLGAAWYDPLIPSARTLDCGAANV
jgi:hypothetical protein